MDPHPKHLSHKPFSIYLCSPPRPDPIPALPLNAANTTPVSPSPRGYLRWWQPFPLPAVDPSPPAASPAPAGAAAAGPRSSSGASPPWLQSPSHMLPAKGGGEGVGPGAQGWCHGGEEPTRGSPGPAGIFCFPSHGAGWTSQRSGLVLQSFDP